MSYRTILVDMGRTQDAGTRLGVAVALARKFDAVLIGLGSDHADLWPDPTGLSQQALRRITEENLSEAEAQFRREAGELGTNAVWRRVSDAPTEAIVKQSFAADLIVTSRPPEGAALQTVADTAGLIVAAGLPVLVVPPQTESGNMRRAVVAWKNNREGRRAISDAIPLLKCAEQVYVVRILGARDESNTEAELAGLVERLGRHGVTAISHAKPRTAESVTQDLLDFADTHAANLIVTGAYSRPRLQQWVPGGVTRGLLSCSNRLVLFSH